MITRHSFCNSVELLRPYDNCWHRIGARSGDFIVLGDHSVKDAVEEAGRGARRSFGIGPPSVFITFGRPQAHEHW